ncbi:MAG: ABC transporter ATP-binding protein, partial [Rickettsiales bacterium]|nr:ABC transporter ATP-binding protein [Rickettsiales bacterium]
MAHTNPKAFPLMKRVLREHVAPYRKRLALAIFCMVVFAAATATNAWMLQPALDKIFIERDEGMLTLIPFAFVIVGMIAAASNFGNIISMRYIGLRITADMQKRLFAHLMDSDISLFHHQASGRLISRFTNDIMLMRNAFSSVLTALAKESITMLFLVTLMFYQNHRMALIAMPVFLFAIYPLIRLGKNMRKIAYRTQRELGDFTSTLDEVFQGVRTVKSYNRESYEIGRANTLIENLFGLYFRAARAQSASTPMMETISAISIASVIWYGGFQVLHNQITPGAFFSFVAAFLMAYKPIRSMTGMNGTLQEGLAAASRLFDVLDMPPAIRDKPGASALHAPQGHIVFENVGFHYGENTPGVRGVSLEVPAGKKVALVGMSG